MKRFRERLQRIEAALDDAALVLAQGEHLRYLTGFPGERDRAIALIVTPGGQRTFVTPQAYVDQVREHAWIHDTATVPRNALEVTGAKCGALVAQSDASTCLVDPAAPFALFHTLRQGLVDVQIAPATDLLAELRLRKDASERDALRRAADRTDAVSAWVRSLGEEVLGMAECDLARRIRTELHARGAEREAFPVVVAAGPNGARPTAYRHGEREIRAGEPVVVDFGGIFEGYASDQTRTMVFGDEPPEGYARAHDVVHRALQAGLQAAEPGVTAAELDEAVRSVIEAAGHGDAFTTATGHGIGLRAHEPPTIGPEDETALAPGMAVTIEPGIYLAGRYGVRLETVVIITEDGSEALNTSSYDWRTG